MKYHCLTYFRIDFSDDFDLAVFANALDLSYETLLDFKCDHSLYIWYNTEFDINCNVMIRQSLKDLFGKEEILLKLKHQFNLVYYLERVPVVFFDETSNMILSLEKDIIAFLYKTDTIDDLDYVVLDK